MVTEEGEDVIELQHEEPALTLIGATLDRITSIEGGGLGDMRFS